MKIPPPIAIAAKINIKIPLKRPGPVTVLVSVVYACTIGEGFVFGIDVTSGKELGSDIMVGVGLTLGVVAAFTVGFIVGFTVGLEEGRSVPLADGDGVAELALVAVALGKGVGLFVTAGVVVATLVGDGVAVASWLYTGSTIKNEKITIHSIDEADFVNMHQ